MFAKTDVDALRIYEQIKKQMRLKIGKKLKTASHNSKFTNSYQKRVNTFYTYYFIVDCRQQRYTNL